MSDKLTKAALEELHAFQMERADKAEAHATDLEGQLERLRKRLDDAEACQIEIRQAHLILDAIQEAPKRAQETGTRWTNSTTAQRTVSQRIVGLTLALVRKPEPAPFFPGPALP